MTSKDQRLEMSEARVTALEKEVHLLKQFIIRDYAAKHIEADTALELFKHFKNGQKEDN